MGFIPDKEQPVSSGFTPDEPVATAALHPTAEQTFASQYIAEAQRPLLSKALIPAQTALSLIPALVKQAVEGAKGVGELYASGNRSEVTRNAYQTGLETLARPTYDVLNAVRQAIQYGVDQPKEAGLALRAVASPIGSLAPLIQLMAPRTPSSDEVSAAFKRDLANKAFEEVRGTPIAPEIFGGKANIPVAEALPLVAGAPSGVGTAVKVARTIPAVEATARAGGAIGRAIGGGAKMALRGILPESLEKNIVKALDPKANAIDPAKTVQAMKDAELAVKRVLPDMTPEDMAHPQTLADNAVDKLQKIHSQRAALAGAPSQISLDPLADVYLKMARDPVLNLNPKLIPQLEERAKALRGKTLTGSDAERFNQYLNAENETLFSQVTTKRANTRKANPMVAANEEAAKSLRVQLDKAFGNEFGELGKDYGAWRNIADLAQKQAVKQAKIEGRLNLYEGLSALQAIGASGEPLKAGLSLAGGQVLKYAGSPLARFETSSARLAEAIKSGTIKPRPPTTPSVLPPVLLSPLDNPVDLQDFIRKSLERREPPTGKTVSIEALIEEKIRTYPKKLRNDPALARIAAKSELGIP